MVPLLGLASKWTIGAVPLPHYKLSPPKQIHEYAQIIGGKPGSPSVCRAAEPSGHKPLGAAPPVTSTLPRSLSKGCREAELWRPKNNFVDFVSTNSASSFLVFPLIFASLLLLLLLLLSPLSRISHRFDGGILRRQALTEHLVSGRARAREDEALRLSKPERGRTSRERKDRNETPLS